LTIFHSFDKNIPRLVALQRLSQWWLFW